MLNLLPRKGTNGNALMRCCFKKSLQWILNPPKFPDFSSPPLENAFEADWTSLKVPFSFLKASPLVAAPAPLPSNSSSSTFVKVYSDTSAYWTRLCSPQKKEVKSSNGRLSFSVRFSQLSTINGSIFWRCISRSWCHFNSVAARSLIVFRTLTRIRFPASVASVETSLMSSKTCWNVLSVSSADFVAMSLKPSTKYLLSLSDTWYPITFCPYLDVSSEYSVVFAFEETSFAICSWAIHNLWMFMFSTVDLLGSLVQVCPVKWVVTLLMTGPTLDIPTWLSNKSYTHLVKLILKQFFSLS